MKIVIDTKIDSKEDISKTIEFLTHLINQKPKQIEEEPVTQKEQEVEEIQEQIDEQYNDQPNQLQEENKEETDNTDNTPSEEYLSIPADDEEDNNRLTPEPAEAVLSEAEQTKEIYETQKEDQHQKIDNTNQIFANDNIEPVSEVSEEIKNLINEDIKETRQENRDSIIQIAKTSIVTDEDNPSIFHVEKEELPPLFDEPTQEEKLAAQRIISYD